MKKKIGIVCLLLIFVYCLSAVCAADLNQTTDDIKTNNEKESIVVLEDNNNVVDNVSCEEVTTDDVAEVEVDNNVDNNTNCSEVNFVPHKHSKINKPNDIRDIMPIGMDMRDILKTLGNQTIENPIATCLKNHTQSKGIPVYTPTPKVSFAMGSKLTNAENSDLISPIKTPKYTPVKKTPHTNVNSFSIHLNKWELIYIGSVLVGL